jgi:hypothetical protein
MTRAPGREVRRNSPIARRSDLLEASRPALHRSASANWEKSRARGRKLQAFPFLSCYHSLPSHYLQIPVVSMSVLTDGTVSDTIYLQPQLLRRLGTGPLFVSGP